MISRLSQQSVRKRFLPGFCLNQAGVDIRNPDSCQLWLKSCSRHQSGPGVHALDRALVVGVPKQVASCKAQCTELPVSEEGFHAVLTTAEVRF